MPNSCPFTAEELLNGKVFLIDKPYGWTSFQVVNKLKHLIRNHFHIKKIKIGHAGTLDPLATGLLIVCTGKSTKKIETFQLQEKEYCGTFFWGATTPCFDGEKPIDAYYPTEHITESLLNEAANHFTGTYDQIPPLFSAVKIEGKRAFDYARNNEDVCIAAKKITVSAFKWTRIALPETDFHITCSKGTYIRSLARDVGQYLHSGAYMTALRRVRIGEYKIGDALSMEEVEQSVLQSAISDTITPL